MSGYLERLAARSVGAHVANARPRPSVPFTVTDDPHVAAAPFAPARTDRLAGLPAPPPRARGREVDHRLAAVAATTPDSPAAASDRPRTDGSATAPAATPASVAPCGERVVPASAAHALSDAVGSPRSPAAAVESPPARQPAAPPHSVQGLVPDPDSPNVAWAVTAAPAERATAPPAGPARDHAAIAVAEPSPAVRVHIGRLEIRANLQAAPPPPPARSRDEPRADGRALSDYLRGERGRR